VTHNAVMTDAERIAQLEAQLAKIQHSIQTLFADLDEMYELITDGLPEDSDGVPKPDNVDLADALKSIDKALTGLSRLVFYINRSRDPGWRP
jgi:hypothetical protein